MVMMQILELAEENLKRITKESVKTITGAV